MNQDYLTFLFGLFPRKKGVLVFLNAARDESASKCDPFDQLLPLEVIRDPETKLVVVAVQDDQDCKPEFYFDILAAINVRPDQRLALSFYDEAWNRTSEHHYRAGNWLEGSRDYVHRLAAKRGADVKLKSKAGNLQAITLIRKPNYAIALLGFALLIASAAVVYLFFIGGTASPWSSLILVPLGLLSAGSAILIYCLRKCVTRYTAGEKNLTHERSFLGHCRRIQIAAEQIQCIAVEWHRSSSDAGRGRSASHFMILLVCESGATTWVASASSAHEATGKANLISDLLDVPVEMRSAEGAWAPDLRRMGSDCDIPERWCPAFLMKIVGK